MLRNISFEWRQGEVLGIIGGSGSGKSTLGRLLLGIERPDSGSISYNGKPITDRNVRLGSVGAVFQDYTSSINPFFTVRQAIMEPLRQLGKTNGTFDFGKLLRAVGLSESYLPRYPHELSGGEAQRVCIARSIAAQPSCILLDEAISSLDGTVQMQVLELLKELKMAYNMGYIFITHDIQAAVYMCDRIMIIHGGEIAELIETAELKHARSAHAMELLSKVLL